MRCMLLLLPPLIPAARTFALPFSLTSTLLSPLPLVLSPALSSAEHRVRLGLVSMTHQPLPRLLVQIAQRSASRDHHPHGKLCVGRQAWLPLSLGYKKFLHLFYIARAQHRI